MISVDTVYQTVLALANKEQRGYITPQEFNLYADQAQMTTFEQYFYDLNQFKRVPGNDSSYADMVNLIEDKISIFKKGPTDIGDGNQLNAPSAGRAGFYRVTDVFNTSYDKLVEQVKSEDIYKTQYSPLTKATTNRPVYYIKNGIIYFLPTSGAFQINWIRRPVAPKWTYIVVNEKPLYDGGGQDFELHPSDQVELVIKILQLAGITIKDYNLAQAATQEEVKNIQQEKQ